MSITVEKVTKRFGNFAAVNNVSLDVPDGALLALLGPSGCGKTTLLRIIAGLEVADTGKIIHHHEDVTRHSAQERKVGFVFQHYALFRHMTIGENVGFGLKVRGVGKAERAERVHELLKLIRMETHANHYPSQLSGGQRQRVALARALAAKPRVLLLDEPFGALDAKVRQELRQWLRRLHDEIHVTSLFVTHDQEEAFEVADRVVVMNKGRVEQAGTPAEVFESPANAFVMDFLGNVNQFKGRVEAGKAVVPGLQLAFDDYGGGVEGRDASVFVRPHEMTITRDRAGETSLAAKILHLNPTGSMVKIQLRAIDFDAVINAEIPGERFTELALSLGETVYVSPRKVRVFAESTADPRASGKLDGSRLTPVPRSTPAAGVPVITAPPRDDV
jgi:sulfate/thiosulfate transport system ATP-binding protein